MSGIDSYINSDDTAQKQTHLTYENPSHPEFSGSYSDDDTVAEHYNAALYIKNSPIDRRQIVGDFMLAIEELHRNGNTEELEQLFEELTAEE